MRLRQAKKLHKGDEVILKRMRVPMTVIGAREDGKTLYLECTDIYGATLEVTHLEVE